MNEVYEFRKAPNRGVIWLSAAGMILLVVLAVATNAPYLRWMISALGAAMIFWMVLPKPAAGIRVDDDHLTLAAWREPRKISLDDIAYLRATGVSADSDVTIVYKDGREEGIFAGDLPGIEVLAVVMAERGIPVRDIY